MPNLDTGRVRAKLACEGGRVSAVQVSSERPDVTMLLRGSTAGQAVQRVPALFALCGQAQSRAAVLALAAARGEECPAQLDAGVQREMLREHLWRCLLDLPVLLGAAAMQQEFVRAVKWVAEGKRDELSKLLASPPIATLRQQLNQAGESQTFAPRLLPPLDAKNSLAAWSRLSAEFCRLPSWRGMAAETGAIARRAPIAQQAQANERPASRLSARWLARLDELQDWAAGSERIGAGGTVSAAPVASGTGRALIETARGILMHEVALDGERVSDYLIVAPTEWNFHPQGALADHLQGLEAVDRNALQQQVARIVAALDPCVPFELEWA